MNVIVKSVVNMKIVLPSQVLLLKNSLSTLSLLQMKLTKIAELLREKLLSSLLLVKLILN